MFSKSIQQVSLKTRVLALLLPPLLLVTAAGLWLTRADAIQAANAAFDRSLLGAIKSLDANVSVESGGLAVELPYRLFEFFQLTASGNVYFRVATSDGLVEIGHADLPPPPQGSRVGEPAFYDATYFGEAVRVGSYTRSMEAGAVPGTQVTIQVAESTTSRESFTAGFLGRAVLRDLALLAVLLVLVGLAIAVGLRPMVRLAHQARARAPDDLQPLPAIGLPRDLAPLVDAVNQQLVRTRVLMDGRRAFLDDASHQLRTPLTVLRAQLDFALREQDGSRRESALRALSDELGNAIRGTNQLLTLARSDAQASLPEAFDLGELARTVAIELLPLARARGMDLGVGMPVGPLPAVGHADLLREALLNLLHNALHHGRDRGVVALDVTGDAQGFCVTVTDDGPGIAPELWGRLAQRFSKGRGSRGSGLGLAIARSVMERHHGRLELQPGPDGKGLKAELRWPR